MFKAILAGSFMFLAITSFGYATVYHQPMVYLLTLINALAVIAMVVSAEREEVSR